MLFYRTMDVFPNTRGFLYRKHSLGRELEPGTYRLFDPAGSLRLVLLPVMERQQNIVGTEMLAKDLIAFRISYSIRYKIRDGKLLLTKFDVREDVPVMLARVEERLHADVQKQVRNATSRFTSEELLEKRDDLTGEIETELNKTSSEYGVEVTAFVLRDTNFPKNIQDLFAKRLEARIRSQADLENARTQVAAARTLKNASELMKGDDNLRFLHVLELLEKIASKGKHTFVVGDIQNSSITKQG